MMRAAVRRLAVRGKRPVGQTREAYANGTDRFVALLQACCEPSARQPVSLLSQLFRLRARSNPVSWRRARHLPRGKKALPMPSVFSGRHRSGSHARRRRATRWIAVRRVTGGFAAEFAGGFAAEFHA